MTPLEIIYVTSMEEQPLTPKYIRSKFKTVDEWLTKICQAKKT